MRCVSVVIVGAIPRCFDFQNVLCESPVHAKHKITGFQVFQQRRDHRMRFCILRIPLLKKTANGLCQRYLHTLQQLQVTCSGSLKTFYGTRLVVLDVNPQHISCIIAKEVRFDANCPFLHCR